MSDNIDVAVALLEAGADVDAKNEGEETPLLLAAKEGNTKWVYPPASKANQVYFYVEWIYSSPFPHTGGVFWKLIVIFLVVLV